MIIPQGPGETQKAICKYLNLLNVFKRSIFVGYFQKP